MARPLEFNRNKALEEAMTVFWRQGFEATTVDDLTGAMKIKRQSLYNAFGDKHSLYMEALKLYRILRGENMLACLTGNHSVKEGFERLFRSIIDEAVDDPECKGCMVVNAMTELAAADLEVGKVVEVAEAENEAVFAEAVRQAQARGEIDAAKDPQALAAFLYNTVIGLRVRARKQPNKTSLENIVEVTLAALD